MSTICYLVCRSLHGFSISFSDDGIFPCNNFVLLYCILEENVDNPDDVPYYLGNHDDVIEAVIAIMENLRFLEDDEDAIYSILQGIRILCFHVYMYIYIRGGQKMSEHIVRALQGRAFRAIIVKKKKSRNSEREERRRGGLLASRCSARSRRHRAGRIHTARVQITAFSFRLFAAES